MCNTLKPHIQYLIIIQQIDKYKVQGSTPSIIQKNMHNSLINGLNMCLVPVNRAQLNFRPWTY